MGKRGTEHDQRSVGLFYGRKLCCLFVFLIPMAIFALSMISGPSIAAVGIMVVLGCCIGVFCFLTQSRRKQRTRDHVGTQHRNVSAPRTTTTITLVVKNKEQIERLYGSELLDKALRQCAECISGRMDAQAQLTPLGSNAYRLDFHTARAHFLPVHPAQQDLQHLVDHLRETFQDPVSVDDKTIMIDVDAQAIMPDLRRAKQPEKTHSETADRDISSGNWAHRMPEMT